MPVNKRRVKPKHVRNSRRAAMLHLEARICKVLGNKALYPPQQGSRSARWSSDEPGWSIQHG